MPPVIPVPAATILMLRDGPTGLEVFMVVRHHQIDFASGALVFPGGKIDPGDYEARDYCAHADSINNDHLALQVGAIREAFEECGILLARDWAGELIEGKRLSQLESHRDQLNNSDISIAQFLHDEELILACDLLQPFSHWVTPSMMPKRFDTHFYLAEAPEDHVAVHDGHESVDSIWISPTDVLEGAKEGKYTVILPTRLNVKMLGESETLDQAMSMARDRTIVTVEPWTEERDGVKYLCIPPEAGYSISEEKLEF
ncbi:MAG TPA: NUDIX hydrolase [Gammaproteobacteria bacterium]|nr:NUDIX hydrolase [Gammaproteobacteria bacterium]